VPLEVLAPLALSALKMFLSEAPDHLSGTMRPVTCAAFSCAFNVLAFDSALRW